MRRRCTWLFVGCFLLVCLACGPLSQIGALFGPSFKVPRRFDPLEAVVESSAVARGVTTTVYQNAFTHDLDRWLQLYPEGSVEQEALLRHEQVHAKRQLEMGDLWFVLYFADASFRWREEKQGYREEIRWLHDHGRYVDVMRYADAMSGDAYDFGGRMTSYDEANGWILSVLAGN